MSEIRELRVDAGLTQAEAAELLDMNLNTFGSYEREERTPDYKQMDKIRRVLGEAAGRPPIEQHEHLCRVEVQDATAGVGGGARGSTTMILDERFLEGTGIDTERHRFLRLVGSGLEPVISHGQVVAVDPCERVLGTDLYVLDCGCGMGLIAAIVSNVRGGVEIETRGPSPETRKFRHVGEGKYRAPDGEEVRIDVVGRVVGATVHPAHVLSSSTSTPSRDPERDPAPGLYREETKGVV